MSSVSRESQSKHRYIQVQLLHVWKEEPLIWSNSDWAVLFHFEIFSLRWKTPRVAIDWGMCTSRWSWKWTINIAARLFSEFSVKIKVSLALSLILGGQLEMCGIDTQRCDPAQKHSQITYQCLFGVQHISLWSTPEHTWLHNAVTTRTDEILKALSVRTLRSP